MIIILVLALASIFIIFEIFLRFLTSRCGNRISEFPISNLNDLHKFVNYDPDLGWEPTPKAMVSGSIYAGVDNTKLSKKKGKVKYIINNDGSRWQPASKVSLEGPHVEFFGDSTVFCSGNNHDETFQYYLEAVYGLGPCKNFGVGNYGLDQAYLRAKKRMKGKGLAVLYLPVPYLYRLGVVYKHYNELGNNWAVKPRYILKNNGSGLEFIPRPFKNRNELLNLSAYAQYLRRYDNYYPKFKSMAPEGKKSYAIHYLANKYALNELATGIFYQANSKIVKLIASLSGKFFRKILKKHSYSPHDVESRREFLNMVKGEEGKIFAHIVRQFSELAQERDSKALVIISSQGWIINDKEKYEKTIDILSKQAKLQGVEIYDFGKELYELDYDTLKEYLDHPNNTGADPAHFSQAGNRFLASWLADIINQEVKHEY